jgi:hypothetical protein
MEEKAEKSAKEYDFIQLFPCSEAKYWAYGGASVKKRLVALSSLRLEARNHQRQGQSANGGGSSNDASFETSQWVLPVEKITVATSLFVLLSIATTLEFKMVIVLSLLLFVMSQTDQTLLHQDIFCNMSLRQSET